MKKKCVVVTFIPTIVSLILRRFRSFGVTERVKKAANVLDRLRIRLGYSSPKHFWTILASDKNGFRNFSRRCICKTTNGFLDVFSV